MTNETHSIESNKMTENTLTETTNVSWLKAIHEAESNDDLEVGGLWEGNIDEDAATELTELGLIVFNWEQSSLSGTPLVGYYTLSELGLTMLKLLKNFLG